jgi:hypothetical protein
MKTKPQPKLRIRFRKISPSDYLAVVANLDAILRRVCKHPAGCLGTIRDWVTDTVRIMDRLDE